jgi:hypothetical protein
MFPIFIKCRFAEKAAQKYKKNRYLYQDIGLTIKELRKWQRYQQ